MRDKDTLLEQQIPALRRYTVAPRDVVTVFAIVGAGIRTTKDLKSRAANQA